MADNVTMVHSVTGATKEFPAKEVAERVEAGWLDATPVERKPNSGTKSPEEYAARYAEEAKEREAEAKKRSSKRKPKGSTTSSKAADKADAAAKDG